MNAKQKLVSILNYFMPVLIAGIFAYGLWAKHFDRLIPHLDSEVPNIATISNSDGFANYRFAEDTIWLPVKDGQYLYDGDFIQTDENSKLTIDLTEKENKKNKLIVMPNSFIRIFYNNSRFLIEMHSGSLETDFELPQTIRVKNGIMESTLPLPKARVKINITKKSNSNSSTIQVDQIQEQNTTNSTTSTAGHEESIEETESNTATKEVKNIKNKRTSFDTYPKNGTYLFYNKLQNIKFLPTSTCVGKCQLAISFSGKLFYNKNITQGDISPVEISSSEYKNDHQGKFTWKFYDSKAEPKIVTGEFWIFPYTDKNFSQALKIGAPVEFIN